MIKKDSKKPGGGVQQNFTTGAAFLGNFREWCGRNGYDPKRVFFAGTLMLSRMTHEQRVKFFAEVDAWEAGGFEFGVSVGKIGTFKPQSQLHESKSP